MSKFKNTLYQAPKIKLYLKPNLWDVIAFIIILGIVSWLAFVSSQMHAPYNIGEHLTITLDPSSLPKYAAHTVFRMILALGLSLLFTFLVAPLAAKSPQAEKLLLPLIDILQSVPILGILSITIVGFIQLFPNSLLGPECAAIFAIFTSQVWNMTLSFYQSLRTVPQEYYDAAIVYHLTPWQRFWRIEVPYATPALLWNAMISMSAGWFFVVASEAITVSNQNITLPGIGSYISLAIIEANLTAIFYAIFAMFIVILLYDQLLFRPLLTWVERFNPNQTEEITFSQSWFLNLLGKTHVLKYSRLIFSPFFEFFINPPYTAYTVKIPSKFNASIKKDLTPYFILCWDILLIVGTLIAGYFLWQFIHYHIEFSEIKTVFYLGGITLFKIVILILLASLIWIPIGVWIGLNPKASQLLQPIIQFLAAFPINLIYPILITFILQYHLNVNIWSTPLMILGTQWYILFNVIAGTLSIPKELLLVTKNFGVSRWLWWKRLILPAIFPHYITGAMATTAGCWNASVVADILEWGNHKLIAVGLGSYISQYTSQGDFPRVALGIAVMCIYVTLINRLVWRKLYQYAALRFIPHS